MVAQNWIRLYRLAFALLTFAAVGYQLWSGLQREVWNPVNFFSFFTIQSNIIAAVVLLIGAVPARERISATWSTIRGASTMYMVTTGIVYAVLLSGLEESLQTPTPWVNAVLHQVMPVVMVIDVVLQPPVPSIRPEQAIHWPAYPLLYLVYTLIRGPQVNWYPYPFLDPRNDGGYASVAIYCVVILAVFLALARLAIWLTHRLSAGNTAPSKAG